MKQKNMKEIEQAVCSIYNITSEELRKGKRVLNVADARKLFCYICALKGFTHQAISDYLQHKRTTVTKRIQVAGELMSVDKETTQKFAEIVDIIEGVNGNVIEPMSQSELKKQIKELEIKLIKLKTRLR